MCEVKVPLDFLGTQGGTLVQNRPSIHSHYPFHSEIEPLPTRPREPA